jgi:hypothetical protein
MSEGLFVFFLFFFFSFFLFFSFVVPFCLCLIDAFVVEDNDEETVRRNPGDLVFMVDRGRLRV